MQAYILTYLMHFVDHWTIDQIEEIFNDVLRQNLKLNVMQNVEMCLLPRSFEALKLL